MSHCRIYIDIKISSNHKWKRITPNTDTLVEESYQPSDSPISHVVQIQCQNGTSFTYINCYKEKFHHVKNKILSEDSLPFFDSISQFLIMLPSFYDRRWRYIFTMELLLEDRSGELFFFALRVLISNKDPVRGIIAISSELTRRLTTSTFYVSVTCKPSM